jgi:hypothetical protein
LAKEQKLFEQLSPELQEMFKKVELQTKSIQELENQIKTLRETEADEIKKIE